MFRDERLTVAKVDEWWCRFKSCRRNHLYLRPRSARCGVLLFYRKRKDSSGIAANVGLDPAIHRRRYDVLDERAQDIRRLGTPLLAIVLQRLVKS